MLDFNCSLDNPLCMIRLFNRQAACAHVGIANGFDFFQLVFANDFIKIFKTIIQIFDECFGAEFF